MCEFDLQPTINSNDFFEMREHYKTYLNLHNFSIKDINSLLAEFDSFDSDSKINLMRDIGVFINDAR